MASNPFGITQVDVPGLLSSYSEQKARRLDEMYRAQQIQLEQQKVERQDKRDAALARIFSGGAKGGDQSSGSGGGASSTPSASPPAPQAHPMDGYGLERDLPPRTDGVSINQQALREYYALDPQGAQAIQKFIYDGDKRGLENATASSEAMAVAADAIRRVPMDQRGAELQRWSGWLVDHGIPTEAISRADLSDSGLDRYYRQGMAFKDVVAGNKPNYMAIPQGGTLVNLNDPGAVSSVASGDVPASAAPSNIPNGNPLDPNMRSAPQPIPQRPQGMSDDQIVAQARDAISQGADVNIIFRRLKAWGIQP